MAFTDHSDLFGSLHEEGINLVVRHVMLQRPSMFNYATAFFAEKPENMRLLCVPIEAAKAVKDANNPLFAVKDPIPLLGAVTPMGLNWCLQLTDAQIDFHPGNTITLPSELGTLQPQRLAARFKACFGLDCPPEEVIQELLPIIEQLAAAQRDKDSFGGRFPPAGDQQREIIVLPTKVITCFCLELFVVAHVEWGMIGESTQQWLKPRLDGVEIVDLQPTPMENIIECYATTVLRLAILPQLNTPIEKLVLNITEMLQKEGIEINKKLTLQPTPVSAAVPNNPAIEDDLLKVFINLVVEET